MKTLFDKTKVKSMNIKNRFFKAAVYEGLATEDGHMTEELMNIYKELSKGEPGVILTGYSHICKDEQPNPRMMGIYDDSFIDEYKQFTDMVHGNGSNIVMQIVYGGSLSHLKPHSTEIFGPSGLKNELTGIVPKEMTMQDIEHLIDLYISAAKRVKLSGFDGVQLHAAHGYLLSQFLSNVHNIRNDMYGGSLENRARIIMTIVNRIREAVGEDFPILIKMNSEDFTESGLTSEESIEVAKMLEMAGVDMIEISGGDESSVFVLNNNLGPARTKVITSKEKESYFKGHAKKLSEAINIPVVLTGGNRDFNNINEILKTSEISYFGLGRALIREPNLIKRWKDGDTKPSLCYYCNKCYKTYGKRCYFN